MENKSGDRLPDSVWDDPDYQEDLERDAAEDAEMTSYENGRQTS